MHQDLFWQQLKGQAFKEEIMAFVVREQLKVGHMRWLEIYVTLSLAIHQLYVTLSLAIHQLYVTLSLAIHQLYQWKELFWGREAHVTGLSHRPVARQISSSQQLIVSCMAYLPHSRLRILQILLRSVATHIVCFEGILWLVSMGIFS